MAYDITDPSKEESNIIDKLPQMGETGTGVILTIGTVLTLIGAVIFKNKK